MVEQLCYNRGCGKKFNPSNNPDDSCTYHSGSPVFHDAYKSWSCCGKKTTDFSTFLSTPGCVKGRHSNVAPEEPLEPKRSSSEERNLPQLTPKEWTPPPIPLALERPSVDEAMVRVKPSITSSIRGLSFEKPLDSKTQGEATISPDEPCKNGGCKIGYGQSNEEPNCVYHSGAPVFHEGMKFWSCCQRKTSDFQSFLNQEGCQRGEHKWIKDNEGGEKIDCRFDWHQTADKVTMAIYAKNYDPVKSYVEMNPVRLVAHIFFPEEGGAFDMDLELNGIINVEQTDVSMMGTKVEITMKKAEWMSWSKLSMPKIKPSKESAVLSPSNEPELKVDALDLDDLDLSVTKSVLSHEASGGKTGAKIL